MKNNKSREKWKNTFRKMTGICLIGILTAIYSYIWFTKLNNLQLQKFQGKGNIITIAFYMFVLFVLLGAWGGFKIGYYKLINLILSQVISVICTNVISGVQVVLILGDYYKVPMIIMTIIFMTIVDIVVCFIMAKIFIAVYIRLFPPYQILQINGDYTNDLRDKMDGRSDKYKIGEEISIHAPLEEIYSKMLKYDAVLINDVPAEIENKLIKYCFKNSIRVYFTPKISDIIVKSTTDINLFDSPLFLCRNAGLSVEQRILKRLIDIVLSLIGIIVSSPLMLLVAVWIKIYDGGPILFKQKRCTIGGREFWIYKFRSMVVDAEKYGVRPTTDGDERITRPGKFIRAARIDELPQLFNILKGDMSIVGPRPERIEHVKAYCDEIPEFSFRMKVKGGLTGYAQVYGRYNTSPYDKLKMDLIYIVNYSFLLDLQIMLETIKIIFQKESTEGFTDDRVQDINKKTISLMKKQSEREE